MCVCCKGGVCLCMDVSDIGGVFSSAGLQRIWLPKVLVKKMKTFCQKNANFVKCCHVFCDLNELLDADLRCILLHILPLMWLRGYIVNITSVVWHLVLLYGVFMSTWSASCVGAYWLMPVWHLHSATVCHSVILIHCQYCYQVVINSLATSNLLSVVNTKKLFVHMRVKMCK